MYKWYKSLVYTHPDLLARFCKVNFFEHKKIGLIFFPGLIDCVRGTRTQPLICVGCFVHYWMSCAINKGGFFEIAVVVVVDTHLPRFEALAYVLPHFDALTHSVIRVSSAFIFQTFAGGLLFCLRK